MNAIVLRAVINVNGMNMVMKIVVALKCLFISSVVFLLRVLLDISLCGEVGLVFVGLMVGVCVCVWYVFLSSSGMSYDLCSCQCVSRS